MSDDLTTSIPSSTPPTPTNEPPAPVEPVAPTQPVAASPVSLASPAVPTKAKRSSSGRWVNVLLGVAVIVAVGGVAFAVGRTTAPAAASTRFGGAGGTGNGGFAFPGGSFDPNNPGFANGNGNGNGGFGAGRFLAGGGITVTGTVDAVSADSMTITTASGQQITVALDSKTAYHQQAAGSASDVQTGGKVSVELQLGGFRNGNGNGNGNGTNGNGTNGNGNGGTTPNGSGTPRGTASNVTVIP